MIISAGDQYDDVIAEKTGDSDAASDDDHGEDGCVGDNVDDDVATAGVEGCQDCGDTDGDECHTNTLRVVVIDNEFTATQLNCGIVEND